MRRPDTIVLVWMMAKIVVDVVAIIYLFWRFGK